MKILIACEYSARVRDAFRANGHDAWSCDLAPTEGEELYHFQDDVFAVATEWQWDMMIAFPPCTYLTNSNAWRWDAIAGQRAEALEFVRRLMALPIARIAIENPVGAIGTQIRKADQYVQPWHFGEPYQKTTGLWLKNLPKLVPVVTEKPASVKPWCQAGYGPRDLDGRRASALGSDSARSAKDRSRTFVSIAQAMAAQWGTLTA